MNRNRRITFLVVYLSIPLIPLITRIGRNLEYEYTLLTSVIGFLFIPLIAFFLPLSTRYQERSLRLKCYKEELFNLLLIGPLVTILPGFLLLTTSLSKCGPSEYAFWMLVQWFPSYVSAHALYYGISFALDRQMKKSFLFLMLGAIYVALTLYTVSVLWFEPQKRIVSLLYGFIHGPIYDRWIPVDTGIILARLAHLIMGFTLISIFWWEKRLKSTLLTIGLGTAFMFSSILSSRYPSQYNSSKKLNTLFTDVWHGGNFTLYFTDKSKGNRKSDKPFEQLYASISFHISELAELLSKPIPHVNIYIYPDRETKKLWFGGGATDITDVVTPSIHTTLERLPHPTMRHELVHALTSPFAYHGLGFHPNMAFTEGLAMALAPEEQELSLDEGAAALIAQKKIPNIDTLFTPLFWKESGERAYTISGSIIKFLITKYGMTRLLDLYSGKSWEEAFTTSRDSLLREWQEEVKVHYDPRKALHAEARFRSPGVITDLCPHTKATYKMPRDQKPLVRLRQPLSWDPAEDYWRWRVKLDPGDRAAKLNLILYEVGKTTTPPASRSRAVTWKEQIQAERSWPPETLEDIELAVLQSDLCYITDGRNEGETLLDKITHFSEHSEIGNPLLRKIHARKMISQALRPPSSQPWFRYLAGWKKSLPSYQKNEAWILGYLRLRRIDHEPLTMDEIKEYWKAVPPPGIANTFIVEWYKMLGHYFLKEKSYENAIEAYEAAYKYAPSGAREIFEQYYREAIWYRANRF